MNLGVLLALSSAVAYGTSDFVGGIGARRSSPWQVLFVGQVAGALVLLAAAAVRPGLPSVTDIAWAVLAGIGSAAGGLFLFRGLARGRMGLVAPISAVGAATLPVLVGVVLGERSSWLVWAGIVVALPGIWLVSRKSGHQRPQRSGSALIDGGSAGAGFGVLFICLAQIGPDAGLLPLVVNQATGAVLTVSVAGLLRQPWRPTRGVLGWGGASGALGAVGTLTFVLSSGATSLGVAAVITSLYPAVTVLLAACVLRERLNAAQGAGIGICTLAIIALSLD